MATKMENLAALVGERIKAVVITGKDRDNLERGFLILEDDTHVEVYIHEGGVSRRWPSGTEEILRNARRDGLEVLGVCRAE